MSTDQTDLKQEVREYICEHESCGNSYVKSPYIAKALDVPVQRVTPIMGDLMREGVLEVWSDSTNATTYRIHL